MVLPGTQSVPLRIEDLKIKSQSHCRGDTAFNTSGHHTLEHKDYREGSRDVSDHRGSDLQSPWSATSQDKNVQAFQRQTLRGEAH